MRKKLLNQKLKEKRKKNGTSKSMNVKLIKLMVKKTIKRLSLTERTTIRRIEAIKKIIVIMVMIIIIIIIMRRTE